MNKSKIVDNMIAFIEKAERDLQAKSFTSENKSSKNEIVNTILNELDREVDHETN